LRLATDAPEGVEAIPANRLKWSELFFMVMRVVLPGLNLICASSGELATYE
jgi:hypothetical protein